MESNNPSKFTVVTPSFGQLDWLGLCIASVADQTGVGCIDHIVCDAGTPGIEEFARKHGAAFCREGIKVFSSQCSVNGQLSEGYSLAIYSEKDAGMYDAINKGLRMAKGDICSYLNCDEQLLPGAFKSVSNFFAANPPTDVVFGDTIVVDRDGRALCYWRPYVPSKAHLAVATLNTLSCSMFFRRRVVDAGHFFEPQWKVVGDLRWIRSLLDKGRPMACLRVPLAAFTFCGDNLGASGKAREEFEVSREAASGAMRWFRRMLHGARKLMSGAYVRRKSAYDLFTLSDPSHRRRFTSDSLGWTWPGLHTKR